MGDQQAWDDTDLVAEWNAAKQEYQKYHSYAAKGEPIPPEDLAALDKNNQASQADQQANGNSIGQDIIEDQVEENYETYEPAFDATIDTTQPVAAQAAQTAPSGTNASHLPPVPDTMMSNIQDDDLKKLLMSWYYSGYYTGRYEGKQEAYAEVRTRYDASLAKNSKARAKG